MVRWGDPISNVVFEDFSDGTSPESPRSRSRRKLLNTLAAVATILGLGVAIMSMVLALRAERTKELEVYFAARLSLMNRDAGSGSRVRVTYEGIEVENPTKLSVRITNTGQIPIEPRDVEQPLTLSFGAPSVVTAGVTDRNPSNVTATLSYSPEKVRVEHGLLNPGDFINVEILCSVECDWPSPALRVAGISAARVRRFADDGARQPRVAFFRLNRVTEYALLSAVSMLPIPILLIGLTILWETLRRSTRVSMSSIDTSIWNHLNGRLAQGEPKLHKLLLSNRFKGPQLRVDTLLDAEALGARFKSNEGVALLAEQGLRERDVVDAIVDFSRAQLADAVRLTVVFLVRERPRLKRLLTEAMREVPDEVRGDSREYLNRVRAQLASVLAPSGRMAGIRLFFRKLELGGIVAGVGFVFAGTGLAMILAGSWATILGSR